MEQSLVSSRFEKEAWKNVTSFNWQPFMDDDLKRRYRLLASALGPSALPEEKFTEVQSAYLHNILPFFDAFLLPVLVSQKC